MDPLQARHCRAYPRDRFWAWTRGRAASHSPQPVATPDQGGTLPSPARIRPGARNGSLQRHPYGTSVSGHDGASAVRQRDALESAPAARVPCSPAMGLQP